MSIVGCHDDRFLLRKSSADPRYLVPPLTDARYAECMLRLLKAEKIDLAIPTSDADVQRFSTLRRLFAGRVFLPAPQLIDRCRDKYALTAYLRARGVPMPVTYAVTALNRVDELFERLGRPPLAWCRIRTGSGAFGATPVRSPAQVRSWIRWWEEMRGVPARAFTLSEYLPGRDFSCQALWRDGALILGKTFENLTPFAAGSHPGGVSSVADVARTVHEPDVAALCAAAIRTLDPRASGVFCFDVRERADGTPCLTEINAGRFSMSTNLYDLVGRDNMATTYVRLALGEPVDIRQQYDALEDYYMVRDLDTLPDVFAGDEFLDGVQDAGGTAHERGDRNAWKATAKGRGLESRGRGHRAARGGGAPRVLGGSERSHQEEPRQSPLPRAPVKGPAQDDPPVRSREVPASPAAEAQSVRHLKITGRLDRHTMEALRLEVLRLARRHGVTIRRFQITPAGAGRD